MVWRVILLKPTTNNRVTSDFGWRMLSGKVDFHGGVDFGNREEKGDPILTVDDGIVRVSTFDKGYGNYIVIEHDNYCSLYAHLSESLVKIGQKVLKYQTIAEMGSTGHAFGEHLHFEIRNVEYSKFWERYSNNEWIHCVDPLTFIA